MTVMRLREQGLIDLDADISDYLGVEIRSPNYPDVPLTTRMLMQHTSGIVDSAAYSSSSGNPPYRTLQELVDAGGMFTSAKPGTRYRYTNFGAGLMAGVMEGAVGERFYDYMQHAVMEPLNIDGGYLHTKINRHDQIANMYRNGRLSYDLKNSPRREGAYNNLPLGSMYLLGHGDLIISAKDLAKFGIILAGDGTYNGYRFLSQESVDAMNDSYFRSGNNWVGLSQVNTGTLVEGRNLHGHTGSAYGMISAMFFDPADHTGAVFLTNGAQKVTDQRGNYAMASDLFRLAYSEILR